MQNKIIITILSCFIMIDVILIYLTLTIIPIKLKRNCFTFEYGEEISTKVEDYVNANDSILESIKLNMKGVSTEVGLYHASIEYFGEVYDFDIEIVDTIKPKVQLKKVEFEIGLGKNVKAKDLIKEIKDYSKTYVYFYNEETDQYITSKSYTTEGSYIERIVVKDEHGNQSAALRVKIVVSRNKVKPHIAGIESVVIPLNSSFDPLKNVKAYDDIEGDITDRIKVEGKVNVQEVGEYLLTYSVSDSDGNIMKKTRKVTVEE